MEREQYTQIFGEEAADYNDLIETVMENLRRLFTDPTPEQHRLLSAAETRRAELREIHRREKLISPEFWFTPLQ